MSTTNRAPRAAMTLAVAVVCLASTGALAAGLYLAPRGVRPLARGGAFVAGADDLHALSYNPAGLAYAEPQGLIDLALSFYGVDYTRRVLPDSEPGEAVHGTGLRMPLPTLGAVWSFAAVPDLTLAAAIAADYPTLQSWPDDDEAPQRYAALNYDGTAIASLQLGAGYRLGELAAIGFAVVVQYGTFASQVTSSTCDGVICTQPENPDFDSRIQVVAKHILAPAVHVGLTATPAPALRLGIAWQSGANVDREADLNIRLPTAATYADASLTPAEPKGQVSFAFPWQLRAGIEGRYEDTLRVELAYVLEHWSSHDRIRIDASDVTIRDLLALGDYSLGVIDIDRGFRDTWSLRLGSEVTPPVGDGRPLAMRVGFVYEPSAIPDETLTAMTVDLDKFLVTGGAGWRFGELTLEGTIAHAFLRPREVRSSRVLQTNPTRPPWSGRTPIGNGDYEGGATLVGIGARLAL